MLLRGDSFVLFSQGDGRSVFYTNSTDGFLKTTEANLTRPEITHRLSEIRTPTLLVAGDQDVVTPGDIAMSINVEITNS